MAPSLIDKVNTLINANLHSIVDRALQQNSVAVMDEYIRQAENNLKDLEDSAATLGGTVERSSANTTNFPPPPKSWIATSTRWCCKGKNDLAAAAQAELNTKQQEAQDYYTQWQQQDTAVSGHAQHARQAGSAPDQHPPAARAAALADRTDRSQEGRHQDDQEPRLAGDGRRQGNQQPGRQRARAAGRRRCAPRSGDAQHLRPRSTMRCATAKSIASLRSAAAVCWAVRAVSSRSPTLKSRIWYLPPRV